MPRKTPPATPKKPPAPSVPKPADKLDPAAWRAAAKRHLAGIPTTMREKRWRDLYILGVTPEQAAEEAKTPPGRANAHAGSKLQPRSS